MTLKIKLLCISFVTLVMSACVSNGYDDNRQAPPIDRISEEELARIMPKPLALLSLEDLVQLSKEGATVEQIIDKIKATSSFYELTPSQSLALSKQGIDSKVLDYIYTSREQMLRNNVADEINKREKIKRAELDKLRSQQLQQQQLYDPFCRYGPYGYGGFGLRYGSRFGIGSGFGRPFGCW
ncbi:MAG: hypothetical protein RIS87_1405 [Pseudomonadota bacterium]|jgi:hypothetical protein